MTRKPAKPITCPNCGERRGVPIVFGMPGPELIEAAERGEVAFGGCVITPGVQPDRECLACGHEWLRTPASSQHPDGL